jgi:phage terminase large subunit-like protein
MEYMEDQYRKATNMVSYVNTFLQLDLNVWTDSHSRWIEDELWTKSIVERDCNGMNCIGGLDTASTRDFSALTLLFDFDGVPHFKRYFWIPEATFVQRKMNATAADLQKWRDDGWLKVTPGNAMDFTIILNDIKELSEQYKISWLGYDRYKAEGLASLLDASNIQVLEFGQGYVSMSEPTKELEKRYLNGLCTHDGNPVQRWMMGNVLIIRDAADNVKIDKGKSGDKVDGPVSEVMAYGTWEKKKEQGYSIDPDIWKT